MAQLQALSAIVGADCEHFLSSSATAAEPSTLALAANCASSAPAALERAAAPAQDYVFRISNCVFIKILGKGAYGEVWLAQDLTINKLIAVKKFYAAKQRDGVPKTTLREISILQMLHGCPNVIRLLGVDSSCPSTFFPLDITHARLAEFSPELGRLESCVATCRPDGSAFVENFEFDYDASGDVQGTLFLAFELTPLDLHKYIHRTLEARKTIALPRLRSIARDVLRGLHAMHSRGFVHRDIKSGNVLLSFSGVCKLADFGLARPWLRQKDAICLDSVNEPGFDLALECNPNLTHCVVTLWYRAPELLLGSTDYSPTCDVWSFGCLLYELYTLHHLFQKCENELEVLAKIAECIAEEDGSSWHALRRLPLFEALASKFVTHRRKDLFVGLLSYGSADVQDLVDLMKLCLTVDPEQRPSCEKLLRHSFFTNGPYETPEISISHITVDNDTPALAASRKTSHRALSAAAKHFRVGNQVAAAREKHLSRADQLLNSLNKCGDRLNADIAKVMSSLEGGQDPFTASEEGEI